MTATFHPPSVTSRHVRLSGDRHVTEVADLALELLSSTGRFEIPHLPGRPLQVRLGINTGPCVAGEGFNLRAAS